VGCCDRLINNLILMVLKKLGLPSLVSQCLGELWDLARHFIKTMYGTSTVSYGSTLETPLFEPGQGSMCGPLFWLLCYWLIVQSIDPSLSISWYILACKSVLVEIIGFSFVNNTGLGVTSDFQWDNSCFTKDNLEFEINNTIHKLKKLHNTGKDYCSLQEGH